MTEDVGDLRPRVPLDGKQVNLAQLAAEVGTPLTASPDEVVVADETSTVTAGRLSQAVAAHVPDPTWGRSPEDLALLNLRAKAQAVLAGTDTFTAAEVQRILARLVLRATR